jgi:two-component system, sensor histidine kinase YesM
MNRHISIQAKLVLTYSTFFILLISILSFSFYYYNAYAFDNNAKTGLNDSAKKMSQQTDNLVQTMDYISIDLLSRPEFVSANVTLNVLDRNQTSNLTSLGESENKIKDSIMRDSINRTVFNVHVFNRKNDFFTSYDIDYSYIGLSFRNYDEKWLNDTAMKKGSRYMVPPHTVALPNKKVIQVFSLMRAIEGPTGIVGYLEIQNLTDSLTKIVAPVNDFNVLIVDEEKRVVYSNKPMNAKLVDYYDSQVKSRPNVVLKSKNPISNEVENFVGVRSQLTGWTVIVMQTRESLLAQLAFTRNMIIIIGFALILISILFVFVFSKVLTKPLKQLIGYMEEASIYNLSNKVNVERGNNEIELLFESFQMMRERLNEAINDEVKSHSLQLKASLDSLQAQINPHFLYNILNVISSKGLEDDDEEICNICSMISSMLRYSTSTDNEIVTIRDETEHLRNYLNLMKRRFEHKLQYEINIDQALESIPIPKLILQPIVENSLHHGFENCSFMKITVRGTITEDRWQLDVIDNGSGFDEEALSELRQRMEKFEKEIHSYESFKGLKIGGMGLVNTYARMSIFYDRNFVFEMKNNTEGGACISLGGTI